MPKSHMNKIQKYASHWGKWDGTMRIMVATKKANNNVKWLKDVKCYDLMEWYQEGITHDDFIFTTKLNLFSIGTITLPNGLLDKLSQLQEIAPNLKWTLLKGRKEANKGGHKRWCVIPRVEWDLKCSIS